LRQGRSETFYTDFLTKFAEVLLQSGNLADARAAADEAHRRSEQSNAGWWMPEALRIKGEVLARSGAASRSAAEDHFRRSLEMAHGQGALSWEVRSASSLARLLREAGRASEARGILAPVYARFTEGFDTADLIAASRILAELDPAAGPRTASGHANRRHTSTKTQRPES
jgi:predicted ATPase